MPADRRRAMKPGPGQCQRAATDRMTAQNKRHRQNEMKSFSQTIDAFVMKIQINNQNRMYPTNLIPSLSEVQ